MLTPMCSSAGCRDPWEEEADKLTFGAQSTAYKQNDGELAVRFAVKDRFCDCVVNWEAELGIFEIRGYRHSF
jgi:hypothetical protein